MKHTYTVKIVRAVFQQESFEVFKKYEKSIHNKNDKAKSSYERFLC
jgi:arginine-tRNA-protein transferase